jgi:hypothetical protein
VLTQRFGEARSNDRISRLCDGLLANQLERFRVCVRARTKRSRVQQIAELQLRSGIAGPHGKMRLKLPDPTVPRARFDFH